MQKDMYIILKAIYDNKKFASITSIERYDDGAIIKFLAETKNGKREIEYSERLKFEYSEEIAREVIKATHYNMAVTKDTAVKVIRSSVEGCLLGAHIIAVDERQVYTEENDPPVINKFERLADVTIR